MTLINFSQLEMTYPHQSQASLKDIDFNVQSGQVIMLLGRSGSGKTSLSRLCNGLIPHFIPAEFSGKGQIFERNILALNLNDLVPLISSVFQNPKTQHFTLDPISELAFPLENLGVEPEQINERIHQCVAELGLESFLPYQISQLSGGQKQLLAFASAQITQPCLYVLDEVTSNLDYHSVERIKEIILMLKAKGATIILCEHRLAWANDFVDHYYLLSQGRLVESWTPADFRNLSNAELHMRGLRSKNLQADFDILDKKTGNTSLLLQEQAATLDLSNIRKAYRGQANLFDNLNLQFMRGKIYGLMGRNGTGKSSLAQIISGLEKPQAGIISWEGLPTTAQALTQKSYLVMQDTNYQLFTDSVASEINLSKVQESRTDTIIQKLQLENLLDRHPMSLSGGEKQRVAIATALVSGKEILIFDEPTSGLDYDNMQRFGELLNYVKTFNIIIIIITHDIELAANWCDEIIQLDRIAR